MIKPVIMDNRSAFVFNLFNVEIVLKGKLNCNKYIYILTKPINETWV